MTIDYRTLSNATNTSQGAIDKKWWSLDKKEMSQAVCQIVNFLGQYDSKRQTQYQISTRLYGNTSLMGVNGLSFSKITSVQNALKDRVSYNVVQSAVDTVVAKMSKNKPKPMFLTSGGNYKIQRKAKKLDKFCDGIFYENNYNKLGPQAIVDAAIFGDAFIHVYNHYRRVKWERVIPSELYVDTVDGFYGEPRQLHRVKNIDRQVLIDCFPEKKSKILQTNSASANLTGLYQNVSDQVAVVESWHLPSGPDAGDGIHGIFVDNADILVEEWDRDHFPFANLKWTKRLYGYFGQGGAEQIQNIQLEINKLLWVMQRSQHLMGSFKIWLKNGSKIVKEHLNNDIGTIITGDEQPVYLCPPAVPPEYYTHFQTLKNLAYEQLGVSQLSASSQKPAGLDSGKALREYNDIESDRFMVLGQSYEDLALQLGRLSIEEAKAIFKEEKSYPVKVASKRFVETIDWKDIDLEEDDYVMKMFPVSSLPNDPAGRLQTIQEYIQAGFITPREGRRLMDFPDLEQTENLANSPEDYIHMVLEKIVDDGEYTPPDPNDDLQLAAQLVLEYYAQGKCNNLEEEKLEMLRRFKDQIDLLNQKAMQAMQPPPGAVAPQAAPMPQPQSDLVQNVPGVQGAA